MDSFLILLILITSYENLYIFKSATYNLASCHFVITKLYIIAGLTIIFKNVPFTLTLSFPESCLHPLHPLLGISIAVWLGLVTKTTSFDAVDKTAWLALGKYHGLG